MGKNIARLKVKAQREVETRVIHNEDGTIIIEAVGSEKPEFRISHDAQGTLIVKAVVNKKFAQTEEPLVDRYYRQDYSDEQSFFYESLSKNML